MDVPPDRAAVAQRLAAALDRARAALDAISVRASRVAAFQVLSACERAGERLPWLRARAAALRERERAGHRPSPLPDGWEAAWARLAEGGAGLEAAAEGADAAVDAADETPAAGPALRLQRLQEALDVVEEWLARLERNGPAS